LIPAPQAAAPTDGRGVTPAAALSFVTSMPVWVRLVFVIGAALALPIVVSAFGLAELLVLVAIIATIAAIVRRGRGAGVAWYCQHCGSLGAPTTRVKGSFVIEVILWFCLLVPGLLYTVWRLTTKEQVCPTCSAPGMIPADSPRARAALKPTP
jgi:hypothetical protein